MEKMTLKQLLKWKLLSILALFTLTEQFLSQIRLWYFNSYSIQFTFDTLFVGIIQYINLITIVCVIFIIIKWLNKVMSWSKTIFLRFIIEIIIFTFLTNTLLFIFNQTYSYFKIGFIFQLKDIIYLCVSGTVINFFLVPIVELTMIYHTKYQTELRAQQLQIQNTKFEYELLKNQINPHFLFNSLSILNSLITINQNQAKAFTNNLSNVLRYVLDYKNMDSISLEEEKKFLEQYIYLLKTRFGEALHIHLIFSDKYLKKKILPMAIQLLIENVIKHNEISDINPMNVNITTSKNGVSISNQIRLKTSVSSWGIGLENIKNRYTSIGHSIQVNKDKEKFKVSIPYI